MGWANYVALGDSLTAGRDDHGPGGARIGWARRLAGILTMRTSVRCALTNLAFDGASTGVVLEQQLPSVAALGPDLVCVTVGMNDIRDPGFAEERFAAELGLLLDGLSGSVQVSTVAPVAASPSSSTPSPAAKRSWLKSGSRMSFIPTVTLTRSGPIRATEGSWCSSTMATLAPSKARLVSAHGTVVRVLRIPASRHAHPIRAPPGPWSSRPAVRLSPSAT